MISLLQAPTCQPTPPPPADAHRIVNPRRLDIRVREGLCWLRGCLVALEPDHADGRTVELLLELARPHAMSILPPAEVLAIAQRTDSWICSALPREPGLQRLLCDACRGAVAMIAAQHPKAFDLCPSRRAGNLLPGISSLLTLADTPAKPTEHAQTVFEFGSWLLGPRPTWGYMEDIYDFTFDDVALYWVALLRSTDAEAFEWFRSGHVILHECSPDELRISEHARLELERLLATHPGPQDWRRWQDAVVSILPRIRAADEAQARHRRAGGASSAALDRLVDPEQFARLSLFHGESGLRTALAAVSHWFPEATRAGTLPPTASRAVMRALLHPESISGGLELEAPLGEALSTARSQLVEGHFSGVSLPTEGAGAVLAWLRERVDHADDLTHIAGMIAPNGGRARLDSMDWLPIKQAVEAFVEGWSHEEPVRWPLLRSFVDAHARGEPWCMLAGEPLHPAELPTVVSRVFPHRHGPSRSMARRLMSLVHQAAELYALAAVDLGPLACLPGPVSLQLSTAAHAVLAITMCDRHGHTWCVDSEGRLVSVASPPRPTLIAHCSDSLMWETRPVALPEHVAAPFALDQGDQLTWEQREVTISGLHADGTARATTATSLAQQIIVLPPEALARHADSGLPHDGSPPEHAWLQEVAAFAHRVIALGPSAHADAVAHAELVCLQRLVLALQGSDSAPSRLQTLSEAVEGPRGHAHCRRALLLASCHAIGMFAQATTDKVVVTLANGALLAIDLTCAPHPQIHPIRGSSPMRSRTRRWRTRHAQAMTPN